MRTIGLSGYPDCSVYFVCVVPGDVAHFYVYVRNIGEPIQALDFSIGFDFLGGGTIPNFLLGITNQITGQPVASSTFDSVHLAWNPCLPDGEETYVARFDLLYFSLPSGLVCLGPSGQAAPGTTAPTYVSCDGLRVECLGPGDSGEGYSVLLGSSADDTYAPPGCAILGCYPTDQYPDEMPWQCENSITVLPVGTTSWSAWKAGWGVE